MSSFLGMIFVPLLGKNGKYLSLVIILSKHIEKLGIFYPHDNVKSSKIVMRA